MLDFVCQWNKCIVYTRWNQKITVIFKFREVQMLDIRIFANGSNNERQI